MAAAAKKQHPYRNTATRQIVFGFVFMGLGVFAASIGGLGLLIAGAMAIVGGSLVYLGVYARRALDAVIINNEAYDLISRGRIADAEALLDTVQTKTGHVRRAVEIQRAMIALRRADAVKAEEHVNALLAMPTDLLTREEEQTQNVLGQSIRAFARASLDKEVEALADIEAIRKSDIATPESLARATVAEAILLTKKDDREGIARALDRGSKLLDYTAPRERALLRAFRRMIALRRSSVYREPARVIDSAREEPLLGDWVSKIAPQAAAFVPETDRMSESRQLDTSLPDSFPVGAGSAAIARKAKTRPHRTPLMIFLWIVLLGLIGGIVSLLSTSSSTPPPPPIDAVDPNAPDPSFAIFYVLIVVGCVAIIGLFFGMIYVQIRGTRSANAALRKALRLQIDGDLDASTKLLGELTARKQDPVAAAAHLALAAYAERRCEMKASLEHCDAALARISRLETSRALHSDLLVPELIAQRALCLAALNRDQQASAELALISREHPTFAYMTRSIFRVKMAQALRKLDHAEALRLAGDRTPELPLNRRDEMLADLVLALSGRKIEGEIERIASELDDDRELATWVEFMAPGSRERLTALQTKN